MGHDVIIFQYMTMVEKSMNHLTDAVLHSHRMLSFLYLWTIFVYSGNKLYIFAYLTVVCAYRLSQRKQFLLRTSVVCFLLKHNSAGEIAKNPWNLHRGHWVENVATVGILSNWNAKKNKCLKGHWWLLPPLSTAPSHEDRVHCTV